MVALIGALASIGSALIGANAAKKAGAAQTAAIREAEARQAAARDQALGLLRPSIDAGNTARDFQLGALGLPGGVDSRAAIGAFRDSPGYQFALGEGQNQVQTSAAAGGSLFSGKTLRDLTRFGQGMADQQFGNWFTRLGGLSGGGTNAAGAGANVVGNTGASLANLAVGTGDARASSYAMQAGAINKGLGSLADLSAKYGQSIFGGSPFTSVANTQYGPVAVGNGVYR